MTTEFPPAFARQYESHLKHLKLKGLQPKTIDAYSRAIRRLGGYFDYRIDALSEADRACSTTGSDRGSLRDHDLTLIVMPSKL